MEYNIGRIYDDLFIFFTKSQYRLGKFTADRYNFLPKIWIFISQSVKELSKEKNILGQYFSTFCDPLSPVLSPPKITILKTSNYVNPKVAILNCYYSV